MVAEMTLAEAGFEVIYVASGTEALAQLQEPPNFVALVTDIRLGKGPDGWEVARRARELSATIPIVYVSGDSAADWSIKGVPNSTMLSKPYAEAQLMVAVTQMVNAVPPST